MQFHEALIMCHISTMCYRNMYIRSNHSMKSRLSIICFMSLDIFPMQTIFCYCSGCITNPITNIERQQQAQYICLSICFYLGLVWPHQIFLISSFAHWSCDKSRPPISQINSNKQAIKADQFLIFHHASVYMGLLMIEHTARTPGSYHKIVCSLVAVKHLFRILQSLCKSTHHLHPLPTARSAA